MKKTFALLLSIVVAVVFSVQSCQAKNVVRGIIPNVLGWHIDSIVEQWTETKDEDSDVSQITLWSYSDGAPSESNLVPVEKRFNRKVFVTISFINLGSEIYQFDNTSELELSVESNGNTYSTMATPVAKKTVIMPNKQIKKCTFVAKLNKKDFRRAFDNNDSKYILNINPLNGQLNVENQKGESIFDLVEKPGYFYIYMTDDYYEMPIFTEFGKNYLLKDIIDNLNQFDSILSGATSLNKKTMIGIENKAISTVYGFKINDQSENSNIVMIKYSGKTVNNDKTTDLLSEEFRSQSYLSFAIVPREFFHTFRQEDKLAIAITFFFASNIQELPESIAPQKYKDVYLTINSKESFKKLKKIAENGDEEAIDFILLNYDESSETFSDMFTDYKEAFEWFSSLAEKKNPTALFALGYFYDFGLGVKKDNKKSMEYYRIAAELGQVEAMVNYANSLLFDDGEATPEIVKQAEKLYRTAAEKGSRRGQFLYAKHLLFSTEYDNDVQARKEGFQWLEKSAQQGWTEAIYYLAREYYFGINVERNPEKSFELMYQASRTGHSRALNELAEYYYYGVGTEVDKEKAFVCFGIVAKHDELPSAMYYYGYMLAEGEETTQNPSEGIKWIKKSADKKYSRAELYLGTTYFLDNDILPKDNQKAFYWIQRAAEHENDFAMWVLGDFYMEGIGTEINRDKGAQWYKKSAEEGNENGMYKWGLYLYENDKQHAKEGLKFIKQAAQLEVEEAQEFLDSMDKEDLENDIIDLDEENENDDNQNDKNNDTDDDLDELDPINSNQQMFN